jgi:peroxiredoxin
MFSHLRIALAVAFTGLTLVSAAQQNDQSATTTDSLKQGTAESATVREGAINAQHIEQGSGAQKTFSGTDQNGKQHSLRDYAGKIVVLEWTNSECPFVERHYAAGTMKKLADKYKDEVVWLAVDSSSNASPEKEKKFAEKHKFEHPVLVDPEGEIGKAFGAKTTPHIFILDKQGAIAYNGAIDDDAGGDKQSPKNYVDEALAKLVKGEKPGVASTKSYGCGVKYKK